MSRLLDSASEHLKETMDEVKRLQRSANEMADILAGTPAAIELKGMAIGMELAIKKFEKVLDAVQFNNNEIPF